MYFPSDTDSRYWLPCKKDQSKQLERGYELDCAGFFYIDELTALILSSEFWRFSLVCVERAPSKKLTRSLSSFYLTRSQFTQQHSRNLDTFFARFLFRCTTKILSNMKYKIFHHRVLFLLLGTVNCVFFLKLFYPTSFHPIYLISLSMHYKGVRFNHNLLFLLLETITCVFSSNSFYPISSSVYLSNFLSDFLRSVSDFIVALYFH